MKKLSKYLVLFTLTILAISVIVTTTIVYTAHAATSLPTKTTVVNTALTAKTVQLFTNQAINQQQTLNSSFVTTQGYKKAALYVSEVNPANLVVYGQFSIDGVNGYYGMRPTGTLSQFQYNQSLPAGQTGYFMSADDVLGPMFRVSVTNGYADGYPPTATVSVTLYLMP